MCLQLKLLEPQLVLKLEPQQALEPQLVLKLGPQQALEPQQLVPQ